MQTRLFAIHTSIKRFLIRHPTIFLNPFYSTFVTLLLLFTGGLGSIWSNEIRNAFPFIWPSWGQWSWPAALFWITASISGFVFFLRQFAVQVSEQSSHNEQLEYINRLESLIRTVPPENFLTVFAELFIQADKAVDAALPRPEQPHDHNIIKESTRVVLRMIAILAQKFDGDYSDRIYAANIMLYRSSSDLAETEGEHFKNRLLFCDESISVKNLKGILDLDTELSTTARSENAEPDSTLNPFALPIPQTPKVGNRYKILPGAPRAFVDKEPDIYLDTSCLRKWCDEWGDFTNDVKDSLDEYFQQSAQKNVRSFISIPLFRYEDLVDPDGTKCDPLAILNIHTNQPDLLKGRDEPVKHFVSIIHPLQVMLVKLLTALNKIDIPCDNGNNS